MYRPLLHAATLLWALSPAPAQDPLEAPKVAISAAVVPDTAKPGDTVTLEVTLSIADGWHVYGRDEETGIPPRLELTDLGPLQRTGATELPVGVPHEMFGMTNWWVEGSAVLKQKLKVPQGAPAGAVPIAGRVDYMVCDENLCLPPAQVPFSATLTVEGAAAPTIAEPDATQKVTAGAHFEPASVAPGGTADLVVTLRILDGWHLYGSQETTGIPVSVKLAEGAPVATVGATVVPPGELEVAHGFESYELKGEAVLRQTVKVPVDADAGALEITAIVDYMACDETSCDPPDQLTVTPQLTVDPGARAPPSTVQDPGITFGDEPELAIEPRVEPQVARAGEVVEVIATVTVPDGWHVYGKKDENPIRLHAVDAAGFEPIGENRLPDGERHATGEIVNYWVEGQFELRQQYRVPEGAVDGPHELELVIDYLLCDESSCLPPAQEPLRVPVRVEAGPVRPQFRAASPAEPIEGEDELLSLWGLILAAIGGGLFALAMPCTYPMIPITISFFTKQASVRDGKVLPLSLAYGAGIVLVFAAIGLAVGLLFELLGVAADQEIVNFARNWLVNLVIGVLFLAFGLSLLGLFTLQPPRFLMNAAGKASTKGGLLGVFLMGTALVVTSFTCTAPFVGALLGSAAAAGTGALVLGMAVFGLTMAIPFAILSLVPGKMQALPRAGEWMNTLKVALGFIEVAAAMKFFSNAEVVLRLGAFPRELFLLLWAAIFVVLALFLLGMFQLKDSPTSIGPGRLTSGLAAMGFAAYCVFGALGYRMDQVMTAIVPNYSAPMVAAHPAAAGEEPVTAGHTIVPDDYEAALALAQKQGKLLLLNFTGYG